MAYTMIAFETGEPAPHAFGYRIFDGDRLVETDIVWDVHTLEEAQASCDREMENL